MTFQSSVRKALKVFVLSAACGLVWLTPQLSSAQEGSGAGSGSDLTLFVGSHLPNQIEGVTEILPVFGGRYSFATQLGAFELGAFNTHAYGVDFSTFELSLRGEFPIDEGVSGIAYFGGDFNWYTPEGETSRRSETGVHLGLGGLLHVSDTLWLRSDLKFMGNPGTSLYLLFGIVLRSF